MYGTKDKNRLVLAHQHTNTFVTHSARMASDWHTYRFKYYLYTRLYTIKHTIISKLANGRHNYRHRPRDVCCVAATRSGYRVSEEEKKKKKEEVAAFEQYTTYKRDRMSARAHLVTSVVFFLYCLPPSVCLVLYHGLDGSDVLHTFANEVSIVKL